MKIQVLTLFPDMFSAILSESIIGRARERSLIDIQLINIRDFSTDKHYKVDDYPFGGGAGMVLMPQPIFDAMESIGPAGKRLIYLSPKGRVIDQALICELYQGGDIVLLCGHYEGLDQRVITHFQMEEISAGDYILTGGELPAMILIDAVTRMIPDSLGNPNAHDEESFYSGLLEYPQFTQPREYQGLGVPEILLSGNHKMIKLWKYEQSLMLTAERRPDMFQRYLGRKHELSKEEQAILTNVKNLYNLEKESAK